MVVYPASCCVDPDWEGGISSDVVGAVQLDVGLDLLSGAL